MSFSARRKKKIQAPAVAPTAEIVPPAPTTSAPLVPPAAIAKATAKPAPATSKPAPPAATPDAPPLPTLQVAKKCKSRLKQFARQKEPAVVSNNNNDLPPVVREIGESSARTAGKGKRKRALEDSGSDDDEPAVRADTPPARPTTGGKAPADVLKKQLSGERKKRKSFRPKRVENTGGMGKNKCVCCIMVNMVQPALEMLF